MEIWGVPSQDLNTVLFVWWYSPLSWRRTTEAPGRALFIWWCSHHPGDWEQQHLDRLARAWDLPQPGSQLVTTYRRKTGPLQQHTYDRVDLLLSGMFCKVYGIIRKCRFACFLNFFCSVALILFKVKKAQSGGKDRTQKTYLSAIPNAVVFSLNS